MFQLFQTMPPRLKFTLVWEALGIYIDGVIKRPVECYEALSGDLRLQLHKMWELQEKRGGPKYGK